MFYNDPIELQIINGIVPFQENKGNVTGGTENKNGKGGTNKGKDNNQDKKKPEHTKGKRPSTWNKHTKTHSSKKPHKAKQKPGWKQR